MQIVSIGDSWPEVSGPVSDGHWRGVSWCHLLKFVPGVLSVKWLGKSSNSKFYFTFLIIMPYLPLSIWPS